MNRNLLKTVGGILVIGAIVVATFLYGNKQRQDQIKRDEQARKQQTTQQQQSSQQTPTQTPAQTPTQSANQPQTPTQPSAAQTPQTAAPATTPAASSATPKTGGEVAAVLPLVAIALLYRRSQDAKRAIRAAALKS